MVRPSLPAQRDHPKPRGLAPRRYLVTLRRDEEVQVEVVARNAQEARRQALEAEAVFPTGRYGTLRPTKVERADA